MKTKNKAIAYLFRDLGTVREVLVFLHRDFPEAGLQVPGGTVEKNEAFEEALCRELLEETGLTFSERNFTFVGETTYSRKDRPELNIRRYYKHFPVGLPDRWSHVVSSDAADNGLVFNYFWMPVDQAKRELTGNFGELL